MHAGLRWGLAGAGVVAGALLGARLERALIRRRFVLPEDPDEWLGQVRGVPVTVTAADGVPLYVEVDEPSQPRDVTVVFCHGYALNLDSWFLVRRALRDRARLVLWDQRSHGRSGTAPDGTAVIDQLGSDLYEVLQATADGGPVVLVGHSMGGMTIMALAAEHPELFGDRIKGVALVATSAGQLDRVRFGLPGPAARRFHQRADDIAAFLSARREQLDKGRQRATDLEYLLTSRISFGGPVSDSEVQFVTDLLGSTPMATIAAFLPAFHAHDKATALAALGRVPTLVMVGDRDVLTPPDHSRLIAREVPGAELVVVPHTGHMIITERGAEVAERIGALVDRVGS